MAYRAPARTASAFSLGHTKMRATISRSSPPAASATTGATLGTSSGRQPVDDRAVALAPGEAQHALAQGGDEDRRRSARGAPRAGSPGPRTCRRRLVTFSPVSASRRKRTMSRTFLYGSTNGTPFQRSTITFDDVPMPIANRPGAASAIDADALRHARRRAGVGRHDRRAQPQPRLPRRRQRQRREARRRRRPRPTRCRCSRGRPARAAGRGGCAGARAGARSCRVGSGSVMRPTLRGGVARLTSRTARCSSGWRWRAACRPRRTCARARGRTRARRRAPGCRAAPTRSARGARRAACCRGCCRRPRSPSAWPTPIGTKSPRMASAVASTPSITSGMRAHISVLSVAGRAVELVERRGP